MLTHLAVPASRASSGRVPALWRVLPPTEGAHAPPIFTFGILREATEEINQFDLLHPSGDYIICLCEGVCEFERRTRNQLA